MMQCQLCGDENGPFEFADIYDDGKAKVMLICEDCGNIIRKNAKKIQKQKEKRTNKLIKDREKWLLT